MFIADTLIVGDLSSKDFHTDTPTQSFGSTSRATQVQGPEAKSESSLQKAGQDTPSKSTDSRDWKIKH
jgi:hypothetical protein